MSKGNVASLVVVLAVALLSGISDWRAGLTLCVCAWAGFVEGRKVGRAEARPPPPRRYRTNVDKPAPETRSPTGARVHLVPNGPPKTLRGTHAYRYRPALGDVRHNGRGHATET